MHFSNITKNTREQNHAAHTKKRATPLPGGRYFYPIICHKPSRPAVSLRTWTQCSAVWRTHKTGICAALASGRPHRGFVAKRGRGVYQRDVAANEHDVKLRSAFKAYGRLPPKQVDLMEWCSPNSQEQGVEVSRIGEVCALSLGRCGD